MKITTKVLGLIILFAMGMPWALLCESLTLKMAGILVQGIAVLIMFYLYFKIPNPADRIEEITREIERKFGEWK